MEMDDKNFSLARYTAELWAGCSRNLFDESGRWRPVGWLVVIGAPLSLALFYRSVRRAIHHHG